jgi:hypothetical protein
MRSKPREHPFPEVVSGGNHCIEWTEYPLLPPGEYPAYCASVRTYRDPAFKRWTCLLQWDVLTPDLVQVKARVPMWLPVGQGNKPHASRRGRYALEWVNANGGPPVRGDRLSPRVFTRRIARVEIADTTKGPMPYSVVKKILRWETGHSINKSHNQGRQAITRDKTGTFRE